MWKNEVFYHNLSTNLKAYLYLFVTKVEDQVVRKALNHFPNKKEMKVNVRLSGT